VALLLFFLSNVKLYTIYNIKTKCYKYSFRGKSIFLFSYLHPCLVSHYLWIQLEKVFNQAIKLRVFLDFINRKSAWRTILLSIKPVWKTASTKRVETRHQSDRLMHSHIAYITIKLFSQLDHLALFHIIFLFFPFIFLFKSHFLFFNFLFFFFCDFTYLRMLSLLWIFVFLFFLFLNIINLSRIVLNHNKYEC
jgi:hypothetical protein